MQSPTSETGRSVSSLHARVCVVADHALSTGVSTASVAVYSAVALDHAIESVYLLQVSDELPPFDPAGSAVTNDPVTRAAVAELGGDTVREIDTWVRDLWPGYVAAAEALVAISEALPGYRGLPPERCTYRQAGRLVAADAGERCAAVIWAGVAAEARYLRLYGGRRVSDVRELAVQPVVEAARRELSREEKQRIATWVNKAEVWGRIELRAEELLTEKGNTQ